jgi:hypothetical protein
MDDTDPLAPEKPKPTGQHIFDNTHLEEVAKEWKKMVAQNRRNEAMPLLEELIKGCQDMLPRLAQHEGFHLTTDVDTLNAAANSKIEGWLMAWKPDYKNATTQKAAAHGLFSFLSKCAKNAFRSEVSKVNQYRKHFYATGENLEKFYGESDYHKFKDEATQEVRSHLKDLVVRWGIEQEIGCVRFILESITEEKPPGVNEDESATETRERIIRSAAYAWCVSPDMAKFFYSWAVYALRDALYKKAYPPFSEEDILRHAETYTHLPDLMDIIGWEKFKHVIATLGGTRIKLPTMQQLGRLHENYRLSQAIKDEGEDPDTVERVGKRSGRSQKTAQQVYLEMSEVLDHKRCGEHPVFADDDSME